MFGVNGGLHVVPHLRARSLTHQARVGIGERHLALAALLQVDEVRAVLFAPSFEARDLLLNRLGVGTRRELRVGFVLRFSSSFK